MISLRLATEQAINKPILDEIAERVRPTVQCRHCGVRVDADKVSDPARCLDPKCPVKPKE